MDPICIEKGSVWTTPKIKKNLEGVEITKIDHHLSESFCFITISYVLTELWIFFYLQWCFLSKKCRFQLKQPWSRVENQFTMNLINSKLHIAGCSLLQDVLKACCKSITDASIQKAKRLNSKINFVEKGKQPCTASIVRNWTILASCS